MPSRELTKADSASVVALLRWLARGWPSATSSGIRELMRLTSVCRTVVMIVAPPGEPIVNHGLSPLVTIVGAIEERGRLLPAARLGAVTDAVSKSVSSLLSRKP